MTVDRAEFLQRVHIGDFVRIEYERGRFTPQQLSRAGYVTTLTPARLSLASEIAEARPRTEPPVSIWYPEIKGYEVIKKASSVEVQDASYIALR